MDPFVKMVGPQWWQNTGVCNNTLLKKIVGWSQEAYNYLVGVFNPTEESSG